MEREYKLEELGDMVAEFLEEIYLTQPLQDLRPLLVKERGSANVIGLSGNLGAGKTTFTKELLRQLGHTGSVTSPTFVLRRDYTVEPHLTSPRVIHIDAYRLEKPEHIYQVVSKEELADKNNLIIIEWPEKVLPEIFDQIFTFEHVDENTRKIRLKI